MAFNPMQVQAALQNPVRFPDKPTLQNYAQGRQPTGQVTPEMAQQEMAQRGADRQAFQRQGAMQNDPRNKPPVLAEKIMQLQQMEQALGMQAAMLAKKEQDIGARQQGIGALPTRPDMFTAMDGGIVFSGGGEVERYAGGGDTANRAYRRALEKRIENQEAARADIGAFNEAFADLPSTIKEDKKSEDKKVSSTTGASGQPTPPRLNFDDLVSRYMSQMSRYMATPPEVAEARAGISGQLARISNESERARPMQGQEREDFEKAERERLAKEYAEYTSGREGRREKAAEAIRGQKPELMDYLGAMAAGGPKRTLGETLSAMVPGTQKIRAEQQAREMAAAKFRAEAEELDAKADLAERRGQTTAARALSEQADQRRLREFEILSRASTGVMQGLGTLAESYMSDAKRSADVASVGYGAGLKGELEARIQAAKSAYEAGKPTELMRNAQWIAQATGRPIGEVITSLITKDRPSVTPRDKLAFEKEARTFDATSPELQPYLSDQVRTAIAQKSKALTDPSNPNYFKLKQEVKDAQDMWVQSKLYGPVDAEKLPGYRP